MFKNYATNMKGLVEFSYSKQGISLAPEYIIIAPFSDHMV